MADSKVILAEGAYWRLDMGCLEFAPEQSQTNDWHEIDFGILTPEDVAKCHEIKSILEVFE